MIIGVDHGNAQIKTARCCFPAGLAEYSVMPPLASDVIEMDGRIWTLVGKRIPYMRDKTQNESYFILTLFAICKDCLVYTSIIYAVADGRMEYRNLL